MWAIPRQIPCEKKPLMDTKFCISDFLNNGDIYILVKNGPTRAKKCLTSLIYL
jgi:hypothetical protein